MLSGSLNGDFGKLAAFGNKIGSLGSPATMRAISKEIADEAIFQALAGFQKEQDPYGRPWYPKKYPDGRNILRGATGKLMRGFVRLYVGADAAIIGNRAPEARFAQSGTGIYGPSKSPIRPKKGRFLRFKVAGKYVFAREVEGSRQRLIFPQKWRNSPIWSRAFKTRVSAYLRGRLSSRAA